MSKKSFIKNKDLYQSSYIGFVKEVIDSKFAGRIKVWIPELNSREEDRNGWIICNYCSPFGGSTSWRSVSENEFDTFEKTQSSYGFWAVPPDEDNEVLVLFPNGDPAKAIWAGCLFKEYMNYSVPGLGISDNNKNKNGKDLPVTEYNKFDRRSGDASKPTDPKRPWHRHKAEGIGNQGLIKDKIRGIIGGTSMSESPSQIYGMSTPGPLSLSGNGSRIGGSSFVMNDERDNEHILLRTRSGGLIKIDESNDMIYAITSNGNSWVQMDSEGNVDFFGAKSFSVRSKEDINFRADRNVNIEAGQNINIKAAKDTDSSLKYVGEGSGQGGDIKVQALENYHITVAGNQSTEIDGNLNVLIGESSVYEVGSTHGLSSSNIQISTSGDVHGNGNFIADGEMFAQDFKAPDIGLVDHIHNISAWSGPTSHGQAVEPGMDGGGNNSASGPSATIPQDSIKDTESKTDVLFTFPKTTVKSNGGKNIEVPDWWNRDTEDIDTIVKRLMTYEPCPEHKKKGD